MEFSMSQKSEYSALRTRIAGWIAVNSQQVKIVEIESVEQFIFIGQFRHVHNGSQSRPQRQHSAMVWYDLNDYFKFEH